MALALATLLSNIGLLALSSWFIASMAIAGSLNLAMGYTLPAAGIRALAIIRAAGRYAERLLNHDTTFRILASLRLWFYRRIGPLAPARLEEYRSGDLLARIRADIDGLDDYYVRGLVPAAVALLSASAILPFLARFDGRLALIDGLALAAAGLVVPALLALLAAAPGRAKVRTSAELRASIVEEIEGLSELVVLGAALPHAALMEELDARLCESQRRLNSLGGLGEAGLSAASSLAVWGGSLVLVSLVAAGALPPADLAALSVFVLASFECILPLPAAIQKAGEMAEAARRLFEILDAEPAVSAGSAAKASDSAAEIRSASALGLSIRGLGFRYAPGLPTIFEALDLELPAGGRLGLAGPSGVGKSSLFSLLLRFWDYQEGSIELVAGNGTQGPASYLDLRSLGPDRARSFFSALPQAPFLYHASIRENLLLAAAPGGGPGGPGLEERLLAACEAAQLGDLLAKLPLGLDTIVGETGRAVSGGELQRLVLARALLKEAPIYLLDEPTEGLDDATAEALLDAIARRLAGRSVIIISHRERDFRIAERVQRLDR